MQSSEKSEYQLLNSLLSFLCKDREDKFKNKPYNDKDKYFVHKAQYVRGGISWNGSTD